MFQTEKLFWSRAFAVLLNCLRKRSEHISMTPLIAPHYLTSQRHGSRSKGAKCPTKDCTRTKTGRELLLPPNHEQHWWEGEEKSPNYLPWGLTASLWVLSSAHSICNVTFSSLKSENTINGVLCGAAVLCRECEWGLPAFSTFHSKTFPIKW